MPGYIAWLYVYNQSVKKAQIDGVFNRWNEEDFRPTYYELFVAGVDEIIQAVKVEEPALVEVLEDEVEDEPEEVEQPEDEEGQELEEDETDNPAPGTGTHYTPVTPGKKYKVPTSGSTAKA